MTEIGIEQARKSLGDIANRADLAGTITYLTRNGRRIAAITPLERIVQSTTQINNPAAFELVFVDDDETAAEIGITITQSGGAALTIHGEFSAWAPEHSSVDDAVAWATVEINGYTSVPVDEIVAVRHPDWSNGNLRYGFRESAA